MDKQEKIKSLTSEIFKFLRVHPAMSIEEPDDETIDIKIDGNDLSFLIGFRGETLDSLQTYLSQALFKSTGKWHRVVLDINGYKTQKLDKIEQMTKGFIDRVRFHGKPVGMPPMSPSERRHVHMFISQYDDVETESMGEGRDRHIVIKPRIVEQD